jgi:ATP-dependent RNA helicase RhlE
MKSHQFAASIFTSLHPDIQKGLKKMGFEKPTEIQEKVISAGIKGRDLLASAQTGSGKTAAFLLPVMHRLLEAGVDKKKKIRALILAPTRELAAQIKDHFVELSDFTRLTGAAVFGGVNMGPQEKAFRRGVDIMVATPGRLLDHFTRDYAQLKDLDCLILDEADRMLDMGFLPDIKRVLAKLPKTPRQTMLFSATMPEPIIKLSDRLLNNPFTVDIERPPMTASGIEHIAYPVPDRLKQFLLHHLLENNSIGSAIVFTRTKHRANRLTEFLQDRKIKCDAIHANKSQTKRIKALDDFKNGRIRLLIATDIAARGIDVEALSHVVNFDVPHLPDDYIHRSGRTARANMEGTSCIFVSTLEKKDFYNIEKHIGKNMPKITLEDFDYKFQPTERLEIPLSIRIANHRAKKAEERKRAAANAKRRAQKQKKTDDPTNKKTSVETPKNPGKQKPNYKAQKQSNNSSKPKKAYYSKNRRPKPNRQ